VSVRKGILERFPDARIDVEIVWVDILPTDDAAAAQGAARLFDGDARVSQFHDPELATSAAFVDGLIAHPPAWDMYLFFAPGETWRGPLPRPVDWMHQLSGGRGPQERFRTGDDLTRSLEASAARLIVEK
jgi:hypothetical protein